MLSDKNKFDLKIKTDTGEVFEIPIQGSLGLLALGDIGLMAWRNKKAEVYQRAIELQKNFDEKKT